MSGILLCLRLLTHVGSGGITLNEAVSGCIQAPTMTLVEDAYAVPAERLFCVAHVETGWKDRIGSSGECGVTQVLPSKEFSCAQLRIAPIALLRSGWLLSDDSYWGHVARSACSTAKCRVTHKLMGYNGGTAAAHGRGRRLARATRYANNVQRCERQLCSHRVSR